MLSKPLLSSIYFLLCNNKRQKPKQTVAQKNGGTINNNSWIRPFWACHSCVPKPAINPVHNSWERRLYCLYMEEIFLWSSSPPPCKAILWTPSRVFPFLLSHIHAQKVVHTIPSWLCVCLADIIFVSLFLLLFMGFTTHFDTIHGSHYTILANFYLHLSYFE